LTKVVDEPFHLHPEGNLLHSGTFCACHFPRFLGEILFYGTHIALQCNDGRYINFQQRKGSETGHIPLLSKEAKTSFTIVSPDPNKFGKEVEFEDSIVFKLDSKQQYDATASPKSLSKARSRKNAIQNIGKVEQKAWKLVDDVDSSAHVCMGSYRGTLWISRLNSAPTSVVHEGNMIKKSRYGGRNAPEIESNFEERKFAHVENDICGQPTLIKSHLDANALGRWVILKTENLLNASSRKDDIYVRIGDSTMLVQDWTCLASSERAAVLKRRGEITHHKLQSQNIPRDVSLGELHSDSSIARPRTSGGNPQTRTPYHSRKQSISADGQQYNSSMEWRIIVLAGSHDDDLRPAEIRLVEAREQVILYHVK
jgi:hypothetical protein